MKKRIVVLALLMLMLSSACAVYALELELQKQMMYTDGYVPKYRVSPEMLLGTFNSGKNLYQEWLNQVKKCRNADYANEAICILMDTAKPRRFLQSCNNGFGGYIYNGECPPEECPAGYVLDGQCPGGNPKLYSSVYAQSPAIFQRNGMGGEKSSYGFCADVWRSLKKYRSYSETSFMDICVNRSTPPAVSAEYPQQLIDDLNSISRNLYSFNLGKSIFEVGTCWHFQCFICTNFNSCDQARTRGYCPDCYSASSFTCRGGNYQFKEIKNDAGTSFKCITGCGSPNFTSCKQAREKGIETGVYDSDELSCSDGAYYRQIKNSLGTPYLCVTGCQSGTSNPVCSNPQYGDQQRVNNQCTWVAPRYERDEEGVLVKVADGYWLPCCVYAGCNERPSYAIAACVAKINQTPAKAGKNYGTYQQYCGNNACNRDAYYNGFHYYPQNYYYTAYCRQPICASPTLLQEVSLYNSTCNQWSDKGDLGGTKRCYTATPQAWNPKSAGALNTGSCRVDPSETCFKTKTCTQINSSYPNPYDPGRSDDAYFQRDNDSDSNADGNTGYRCGRYAAAPKYAKGWFALSGSNSALESNPAGKSKPVSGCSEGIAYEDLFKLSNNMNVRISAGVHSDQTVTYESLRGHLGTIATCPEITATDDGIRVCETSGSINSSELPTGDNLVVFVNGDLLVQSNITASANTFKAIVVKGRLTVARNVGNDPLTMTNKCPGASTPAHLQGIFLAQEVKFEHDRYPDPTFNPEAYCDKQLVIDGTLAQWQGQFDLTNNFRGCVVHGDFNTDYTLFPTYVIHARPSFVTHTPPWFQSIFVERQEVN